MNNVKDEVYNEICVLYKKSLDKMTSELLLLKNKITQYENTNYDLNYKLTKKNIEFKLELK
jgi:hypothetical protein